MVKRLVFCPAHPTKPSVGQCRQCRRDICLDCRQMTQDGVFCSQNCLEEFRNFRNAMTLATGPGRRRVTLMGLIRYVVILCVLGAVIFAALAALTGTTDIGQMGTQFMRTLRFFLPI